MRNQHSQTHQTRLRAQLLAHAEGTLIKKKTNIFRYWPIVAVPAMALAVFAVSSFWQPLEQPSNPIAQQVAGPLTAQKVFAEAIKHIDEQRKLAEGEYYFTRSIDDYISYGRDYPGTPPGTACTRTKVYVSRYVNGQGYIVRMERADKNNMRFQVTTMSGDGLTAGDKFFYDQAISDANETQVECPVIPITSSKKQSPVNPEEYKKSPAARVSDTISSGNPAKQKEALEILKTVSEVKLSQNQRVEGYSRPVITMSSGEVGAQVNYYFDQETKAFVGVEYQGRSKTLILEQAIRRLPTNDPPEYTRPSPSQM